MRARMRIKLFEELQAAKIACRSLSPFADVAGAVQQETAGAPPFLDELEAAEQQLREIEARHAFDILPMGRHTTEPPHQREVRYNH